MPYPTKYLALDCEMVGCGQRGERACLGRVSIVNEYGQVVYDTCIRPSERVTDYRYRWSGLTKDSLSNGKDFPTVQSTVYNLIKGRTVVGHDLEHDFRALQIPESIVSVFDTAKHRPFVQMNNGLKPSLKFLAWRILGEFIHDGPHDSVEDAKIVMRIFETVITPESAQLERPIKFDDLNTSTFQTSYLNRNQLLVNKNESEFGFKTFFIISMYVFAGILLFSSKN